MPELEKQPWTTESPVLATFTSSEIRSGVGNQDYFLIESEDSGGVDYHLVENNDFSRNVAVPMNAGAKDLDFDATTFTETVTVEGTAFLSIPVSGVSNVTPDFTFEIYKFDGSTETKLGDTVTFTTPALSGTIMLYIPMVVPLTTFTDGDNIRLRVSTSSEGSACQYGIDPANRADGSLTITTTSKLTIPFKLFN